MFEKVLLERKYQSEICFSDANQYIFIIDKAYKICFVSLKQEISRENSKSLNVTAFLLLYELTDNTWTALLVHSISCL